MQTQHLRDLLARLAGQLDEGSAPRKKSFARLEKQLSRSLFSEDILQAKGSDYSFERADLFFPENLPEERRNFLDSIAGRVGGSDPEFRVFTREVPIRSTQLNTSVPLWAGGAALDHSEGPFVNSDGRRFWFDFFRIEKLVALYIQGRPFPALLFNVTSGFQIIDINLPPITSPQPRYNLKEGSIWINSQLLAPNAPPGYYTGLAINRGQIQLSAPPQLIGGKLTAAANTVVTVALQLKPPAVADADPGSPYGIDARNASLRLPERLAFHFAGQSQAIDEAGEAAWVVYGQEAMFSWDEQAAGAYDNQLHRVLIPYHASIDSFRANDCESPFFSLRGEAPAGSSAWALPSAPIDILNPTPAAGIGGLAMRCQAGLVASWQNLKGEGLQLQMPYLLAEPGRINITDLASANVAARQSFELWKDEQNPFGAAVQLQFPQNALFLYNTLANGNEALLAAAHADVQADRPVSVAGEALPIRSKNSLFLLAASASLRLIYLLDDNILFDNIGLAQNPPALPRPVALALRNALFKVTPVNGCLLFGSLSEDFRKVEQGILFLTFGMYAYLPTLPDPYAARLGRLQAQLRGGRDTTAAGAAFNNASIWMWLVCQVAWAPPAEDDGMDEVQVSFHFAPLQNQFQLLSSDDNATLGAGIANALFGGPAPGSSTAGSSPSPAGTSSSIDRLPDYGRIWEENTSRLQQDVFALLDVSTNADLLGVSFSQFYGQRMAMATTHVPNSGGFPLLVDGMDVVSRGANVKAFTVPQISWEPAFNLTPKVVQGDPQFGFNYYPDDGGPTRLINNSGETVPLAPIPLADFLAASFHTDDNFTVLSLFTLPFGMRALALLRKQYEYEGNPRGGTELKFNSETFENNLKGAIQLQVDAGEALVEGESDMFMGSTLQINNIIEMDGTKQGASTLGKSVTKIFNNEFLLEPFNLMRQRGVPLTRMDLSGYGASIFSNWLNPKATIAATSQAKFDVFTGRCAHEIIQVKSILYPWAIRVVRTITLFRVGSGYVYRYDSGWRAESDGKFDFRYYVNVPDPVDPGKLIPEERQAPYEIHPGVVKGLFNVKDIRETDAVTPFTGQMAIPNLGFYVDEDGRERQNTSGADMLFPYDLQAVYFDADVEVENPVTGYANKLVGGAEKKLVPSKGILGFVQIGPRGMPLTVNTFRGLLFRQASIGGPLDCVVDIGATGQQMRLNRFDVSNSFAADGASPTFAAAGRGNVILPKDGSWSMVKHQHGTGEVSPVPESLSVPLIRIGKLVKQGANLVLDTNPANELLRIANPAELLRAAANDTLNYGFLQSTDTQKALFLTPAFKQGQAKLLSKTPPLFADAFRIVNSKAIFPNIGDAASNFGDAISLFNKGTEFAQSALTDAGKQVLEVMDINKVVDGVKQEGYKLLKKAEEFDLPNTEWKLIEIGSSFKIYIEYKADKIKKAAAQGGGTKNAVGLLDFDVDSFAGNLEDKWKSRMSNVALVVDLGPIKRLMTIKGNWDAKKGAEAQYKGSDTDPDLPSPQIEFAPELEPVIELLQILQDLQGENYKDAFQKGLKLAMGNKAGSWEYKLEASKEIPVVRFPMPDAVYNDPNTPLKLEAGLKLGAYFNAALKIPTDASQLLPSAGGYLGFYGRLSVMCVSISAATVYAIGQVNLDIGADTKVGPSLRMKFGFGAQIVVGLPVVGNVSVLFMTGIEIYVDAQKVVVSASLLFQGHAELLGGIVSVTITIEAKGSISRANDRTDMAAQVTFALDISIFLIIDISFSTSWQEQRQVA